MSKDVVYWASTRGLYFLTGAYLVALLYDLELANKFLMLILLFGGILIGLSITEKEKNEVETKEVS